MKKLIIFSLCISSISFVSAQDFKTDIASAKSNYSAGKLGDAHFAAEQAMQEIDMIIGKEVLKLLPQKVNDMSINANDDHVMANVGFIGATIHRSYGANNAAQVEIISNSPMISTLNAFLNTPILGGMMRDENTKVVKIQGYKARLEKQGQNENGNPNYNLQVPFNNALLTLTVNGAAESTVMSVANTIPLQDIAKLVQ